MFLKINAGLQNAADLEYRETATKIAILITDAPPHGLGVHDDGFAKGEPNGIDPLKIADIMAAKGITLYSVGCQPAIGNTMYTIGFMRALAQRCNGRYVPLQDATLLSNVIIGGCREELSLYRSALKILNSSRAVSGNFKLASKNLTQEGFKVTALKFSDTDVEAFAKEVSLFMQAKTLPKALAGLKKSRRSPIPSNNKAGVTVAGN